jgi:hypothetical protein
MSEAVKQFLLSKNVSSSRTTPYNPQGNGQYERYNGIIWQAISLALKSRNLSVSNWQIVLPDALHCIRSLLCTVTNCTPHERFLSFPRRSVSGPSLPNWLTKPGQKLLLRNFVKNSKFDSKVRIVELVQANSSYARIKIDGRESTVSLRDLAPYGDGDSNDEDDDEDDHDWLANIR